MAIKSISEKVKPATIEIDLTGPQGNAFYLLALVNQYGKQLEWEVEKIEQVKKEMQTSDFNNLVNVFDKNFGEYVTLYR